MNLNLGKTLIDDIAKSNIGDLALEYAEVGVDALMEDGIAKDLPIIGSFIGLLKFKESVSNRIFITKIHHFFSELSKVDNKTKEKFIYKNYSSSKQKQELGDKLILILEKQNDYIKAELLGKAFLLYIEEKISKETFYDLSDAFEDLKIHYIYDFLVYALSYRTYMSSDIKNHFMKCGFLNISDNVMKNRKVVRSSSDTYQITKLAEVFIYEVFIVDATVLKQKYIESIKELKTTRYSLESGKEGTIISSIGMEQLIMKKTIKNLERSQFHKDLGIIFWSEENTSDLNMHLSKISENEYHYHKH